MPIFPQKLHKKLQKRADANALRTLPKAQNLVDFSSNDYLGFANNETVYANTFQLSLQKNISQNGATGSRLISGNHELYNELETYLKAFYTSKSALIFNSGYDANIGFFSSVPQRGDVIFYDEYSHASIRDGISLGHAKSYKFAHNDIVDLKSKIEQLAAKDSDIYVVTESVFSMDGDSPDLKKLAEFCAKENIYLVIDEAHAVGVFGKKGEGLVQKLGIEKYIFARIITFGKAIGSHGAAILGSEQLIHFLMNFARSFIYTTGLSPHSVATTKVAYDYLNSPEGKEQRKLLQENIAFFKKKLASLKIANHFIESNSAIQCCMVSGNDKVKTISKHLYDNGYTVKAILSPTVPEEQERLRFCLHSYNSKEDIGYVLQLLKTYL